VHLRIPAIARPLRSRVYRRLWLGQAISGIGDGVFPVALTVAVLGAGRGPSGLGVVFAADAAGAAAGSILGGISADRLGRFVTMAAADALRLAAVLALAVYLSSFAAVVCCAAVAGFGAAIFAPAYFAALPQLLEKGDLQAGNALRLATTRMTRVAGPLLGGFIVSAYSLRAAFLIDAATFLISLATLAGIREHGARSRDQRDGIWRSAIGGLQAVTGRYRWIGAVILQGVFQMAFVIGPEVILLPFALHRLGRLHDYGWILALQGLGTVAGSVSAAHRRPRLPGLAAALAMLAVAPELVILGAGLPVALIAASVMLTGWGYTTFAVLWGTALHEQVPADVLSRVASLDSLGGYILLPISSAFTGLAVTGVGLVPVIACCLSVLAVSTVLPLSVRGVLQLANVETRGSASELPDRSLARMLRCKYAHHGRHAS
jgi:MFS family permease